jgi:hypothetical protein
MSVAMTLRRAVPSARPTISVRFEDGFLAPELVELLHQGSFAAHGEMHAIGTPIDWLNNPSDDIEWHIVLHKFFHAPALVQYWIDSDDVRHIALLDAHIQSWTAQVPPGFIAADVTGRRVRNWVYALALLDDGWPELAARMEGSLRTQSARRAQPPYTGTVCDLYRRNLAARRRMD